MRIGQLSAWFGFQPSKSPILDWCAIMVVNLSLVCHTFETGRRNDSSSVNSDCL